MYFSHDDMTNLISDQTFYFYLFIYRLVLLEYRFGFWYFHT